MFKSLQIMVSIIFLHFCINCKRVDEVSNTTPTNDYTISGTKILKGANKIQFIGANSFAVFGLGNDEMKNWKIDVSREFIGNMKEVPLTGDIIKDSNGSYLYPLQNVVDYNSNNNRVTILCGFGWDGTSTTLLTGLSPAKCAWLNDYKTKLKQIAELYKNQTNVWIEPWNEPYTYNRNDGYTDAEWLNDMNDFINIIRSTGNNNIIVIPCAEQGQDESVLLNMGKTLLTKQKNILFDIHAYEKWLLDTDINIKNRLDALENANIPVFFGETAPMNASVLMNPASFLNTIYSRGKSMTAWVWKKDGKDQNSLLDDNGNPNNTNNNHWGTTYQTICLKPRNP